MKEIDAISPSSIFHLLFNQNNAHDKSRKDYGQNDSNCPSAYESGQQSSLNESQFLVLLVNYNHQF